MQWKFLTLLVLICAFLCPNSSAQKTFLNDVANERIKTIPLQYQDTFYLAQAGYYYDYYTPDGFRRAMECYLEALKLANNYKHAATIVKCHLGIGSVYDANNNLPEAIRYYKMTYDGELKMHPFNPARIIRATYNIASTYAKAGNVERAYHYTLKMAPMLNWEKDPKQLQKLQLLLAHNFEMIGKNEDFQEYFKKLPKDSVNFEDAELPYARLYAECQSKNALLHGDAKGSIEPILQGLKHCQDSATLLQMLATNYALAGDYKNAFLYQQMLIKTNKSFSNRLQYSDVNYRLLAADNLLKERDNNELQANTQHVSLQSPVFYFSLFFLLLCLGIAIYLFIKNRRNTSYIEEQNFLIKSHNDTNNLLMKEIHHRIKNNLQIINSLIEIQLNKPELDMQTSMMEIQTKMGSIAIAHHLMYEMPDMKEVNLQTYFEDMVEMTTTALVTPGTPIKTDINMNANKMTLEKLVTLALAVNEMVINTVKHVLPFVEDCKISLECKLINKKFHFTYKDNGTNPKPIDLKKKSGTGIRLIKNLAKQLDGEIEINQAKNGNISYQIVFGNK